MLTSQGTHVYTDMGKCWLRAMMSWLQGEPNILSHYPVTQSKYLLFILLNFQNPHLLWGSCVIMLIKGTVQGERSVHDLTLLPLLLLLAALFSGLDVPKLKRTTGGIGISNTEATYYLHPCIPNPWQANILPNEQRTLEIPVLTDTLKAKRTTTTRDSGSSTKALAGANGKANSWPDAPKFPLTLSCTHCCRQLNSG